MTLNEVKLRYVRYALFLHDGNRVKTAEYLGCSLRSVRNYINQMKEAGLVEENYVDDIGFDFKFPTNKERLHYIDGGKSYEILARKG